MKHETALCLAIAGLLILSSALGLPEQLGAHPWWAIKTGVIGSTGGMVGYAVSRFLGLRPPLLAAIGAAALVASGYAATQGKLVFVASMAENSLAGRFWFFGWFGVAGAACVLLCGLGAWVLRR